MSKNANSRHYRYPISKLTISQSVSHPDFATVRCHGCGRDISICIDPKRLWVGRTYTLAFPCLEAPYLCESCRSDHRRLYDARVVMDRHFAGCKGDKDPDRVLQATGGFDLD